MLLPFVRELFAEVEQLPAFTRAASHLRESAGRMSVTGLSAAAKALIVVLLRRTVERPFVLVVADNRAAEELLPVLRAFCELTGAAEPDSVISLPARDVLPFQNLSPHPEIQEERATALWKIATGRAAVVVSPVSATTILLRSPEYYADLARVLRRGESFDLEKLLSISTLSAIAQPMWWRCRDSTRLVAAFWTSIRRRPIDRCALSFLEMKSSQCESLIPRASGLRTQSMKYCFSL